jgi:crossover junction endodeoxyribonuclease RuvC
MRVIGIDPGLTRTGYAVVERAGGRLQAIDYGVVRTAAHAEAGSRLMELRGAMADVLARHGPEEAAVERLFFNNNARTAMSVGQAAGVVLLAAAEAGVAVETYTPTEVKQSVAGHGAATKAQVQNMVTRHLELGAPPRPADAADACALAICHLHRSGLRGAIRRALV